MASNAVDAMAPPVVVPIFWSKQKGSHCVVSANWVREMQVRVPTMREIGRKEKSVLFRAGSDAAVLRPEPSYPEAAETHSSGTGPHTRVKICPNQQDSRGKLLSY